MRSVELIISTLIVAGCLNSSKAEKAFTYSQICKAGIATVMGRDPKAMIVGVHGRDFLLISYSRTEDEALLIYKCKILNDRIHWGNVDGRWRDNPADSVLTFYKEGEYLVVQDQYPDGSSNIEQFTFSELGTE